MDTKNSISPVAQRVIAKCGGYKEAAQIVGRSESWVYRWTYPKNRGGTGGDVPKEAQQILVLKGICQPADFFDLPSEAAE